MPEPSLVEKAFELLHNFLVQEPQGESLQDWPGGPESVLRSVDTAVDDYIDCIRELEAGPAGSEGIRVMVQRLRRLYFSIYTSKVANGKQATNLLMDMITMPVMDLSQPPLTTTHLSQRNLNKLYETSTVLTRRKSKVAISHIWTAMDFALNSFNPAAATVEGLILKTPIPALATWLGDLASAVLWFELKLPEKPRGNEQSAREIRLRAMASSIQEKAGKGDMLGNLDGVALGRHIARNPQAFKLSDVLQEYYDKDALANDIASQLGRPSAAYRFHYFLKHADPQLPSGGLDSVPFAATLDKPEAMNQLPRLVEDACEDIALVQRVREFSRNPLKFVFEDSPGGVKKPLLERLDRFNARHAFYWLCYDFCRFLDDGINFLPDGSIINVTNGDVQWPSDPSDPSSRRVS